MNSRILVTDDIKSWQLFHINLIKQLYGDIFDFTQASSAKEALNFIKRAKRNPYALIITDLQMESDFLPLTAGEWLIENVKMMKEYGSNNIIIISSMYNIEDIAKKYNVNCISKTRLISNKLLMKYMLEKLMPFLNKIQDIKKTDIL